MQPKSKKKRKGHFLLYNPNASNEDSRRTKPHKSTEQSRAALEKNPKIANSSSIIIDPDNGFFYPKPDLKASQHPACREFYFYSIVQSSRYPSQRFKRAQSNNNERPDPQYWGWVVVADGKEPALETWGGGLSDESRKRIFTEVEGKEGMSRWRVCEGGDSRSVDRIVCASNWASCEGGWYQE
jgi:hypothetical protein